MHAHERTLLGKMGFKDPDKKDRRHDLACQYLARPEIATRLLPLIPTEGWESVERAFLDAKFEAPVTKEARWSDPVAPIVGFMDLFVIYAWSGVRTLRQVTERYGVLVEVKIQPVAIGDILRQVGLYLHHQSRVLYDSDYVWANHVVVATAYDLSVDDVAMLTSKKILHVRLSKDFDSFCATSTERVSESLEI